MRKTTTTWESSDSGTYPAVEVSAVVADGSTARAVRPERDEPRPTLRAKGIPRTLNPTRARARLIGAVALDNACRRHGLSSAELAEDFGLKSDREGDELRAGAIPAADGETILLPRKIPVGIDAAIEIILHRVAVEPAGSLDAKRALDLLHHVLAIRDILSTTPR
jgi:hypothetical protein